MQPTATTSRPPTDTLTPAMRQYVEQKQRVGEAILFFRMGDFYETFYDDAVLCSKVLGITLTARSKGKNPIPLAGIPYHALDGYLKKLVDAGYKVAISEQLEDPKQAKGVVKRDVVRVVTAGTLTDDSLLDDKDDNILASIRIREHDAGLALVELASGRFEVVDVTRESLLDELVRAKPAELLIDDERGGASDRVGKEIAELCATACSRRAAHEFSDYQAEQSLLAHFGVSTLAGFGFEHMTVSLCAAGAIIGYLEETQQGALPHIVSLRRRVASDHLQIDHHSWRSLEIESTLRSGQREGTLRHAIDRTVHPIGARKLRSWLRTPLTDEARIVARQDAVSWFVESEAVRGDVRKTLRDMADIERISARVALARTGPRDLKGLGRSLAALPALSATLTEARTAFLGCIAEDVAGLEDVAGALEEALRDDPAPGLRDGGYIADGYDEELDRLRRVRRDGQGWLAAYQQSEIARTGITSLKVGFNRVFGYYLEVPNSARGDIPPEYVRKQTIKSAERYITDELKRHETDVLTAEERANDLEYSLFERLRDTVAQRVPELLRVADALGRLDVVTGFAELAAQRRYSRPTFTDAISLHIVDGRHPVLDQTLGDGFVPNDTSMASAKSSDTSSGDGLVWVITGPNMAGKSTYIRQCALLTLMAQIGSFVPAKSMLLSTADRIFARVGASDEIMRGRSTFMVEMTEAANILRNATQRSLVVLDELGRGTSTFDGLSLAWAITEHLACDIQCRCLVATHYHELTELAELISAVRNYNVAVREQSADTRSNAVAGDDGPSDARPGDEDIVFLHRIIAGGASKSYGLHVARLAGIPPGVIARGREVLEELQRGFAREAKTPELARKKTKNDAQMTLFRDPADDILGELRDLSPDRMTPLEALERLTAWKDRLGS